MKFLLKKYINLFVVFFLAFTTSSFTAKVTSDEANKVLGIWLSASENEKLEVYKNPKDGLYYGKLIWVGMSTMPDGGTLQDRQNPDESLRDRDIIGIDILSGFKYIGNGNYTDGKIYDVTHGKTYDANINITGDVAKIRAYFLIPLIGRTEIANRVKQ